MNVLGFSIERSRSDWNADRADREALGVPRSVLTLLGRTRFLYRFWWCTHYAIGLSGVIAGALLTALTAAPAGASGMSHSLNQIREFAWLIGIIAAVATSLVTFLGPLHKAERYWSAYHILEQACLEYLGNENDPKLGRLMKRVMQVRRILQVVDIDEKITGETKSQIASLAADTAAKPT